MKKIIFLAIFLSLLFSGMAQTNTQFLGAPNTLVENRGFFLGDSASYFGVHVPAPTGAILQVQGDSKFDPRGFFTSDTFHTAVYLSGQMLAMPYNNLAVSGNTMVSHYATNLASLSAYTTGSFQLIELGVNDAIQNQNIDTFRARFRSFIDTLTIKWGFPASSILLVGIDTYNGTFLSNATVIQWNDTIQNVASAKGCKFYNIYSKLIATGGGYYTLDDLHGQDNWNYIAAKDMTFLLSPGVQTSKQSLAVHKKAQFDSLSLTPIDSAKTQAQPLGYNPDGSLGRFSYNALAMLNPSQYQVGSLHLRADKDTLTNIALAGINIYNQSSIAFGAGVNINFNSNEGLLDVYNDVSSFNARPLLINARATPSNGYVMIGNGTPTSSLGNQTSLWTTNAIAGHTITAYGGVEGDLNGISMAYNYLSKNISLVQSFENLGTLLGRDIDLQPYGGVLRVGIDTAKTIDSARFKFGVVGGSYFAGVVALKAPATGTSADSLLVWHHADTAVYMIAPSSLVSTKSNADLTGQTTAVTVTSFAVPGSGSFNTFRVGGYLTVTAVSLDVIQLQVAYTDETSTPRTQSFFVQGATTGISATGANGYSPIDIRVKQGTTITVATVLTTGTGSITYDVGANITQLY